MFFSQILGLFFIMIHGILLIALRIGHFNFRNREFACLPMKIIKKKLECMARDDKK